MTTIAYKDRTGFLLHFKVSDQNPRNFQIGDKYIVIGFSDKPTQVVSQHQADKINQTIVNDIRRVLE